MVFMPKSPLVARRNLVWWMITGLLGVMTWTGCKHAHSQTQAAELAACKVTPQPSDGPSDFGFAQKDASAPVAPVVNGQVGSDGLWPQQDITVDLTMNGATQRINAAYLGHGDVGEVYRFVGIDGTAKVLKVPYPRSCFQSYDPDYFAEEARLFTTQKERLAAVLEPQLYQALGLVEAASVSVKLQGAPAEALVKTYVDGKSLADMVYGKEDQKPEVVKALDLLYAATRGAYVAGYPIGDLRGPNLRWNSAAQSFWIIDGQDFSDRTSMTFEELCRSNGWWAAERYDEDAQGPQLKRPGVALPVVDTAGDAADAADGSGDDHGPATTDSGAADRGGRR